MQEDVAIQLTTENLEDYASNGLNMKLSGKARDFVLYVPPYYFEGFRKKLLSEGAI